MYNRSCIGRAFNKYDVELRSFNQVVRHLDWLELLQIGRWKSQMGDMKEETMFIDLTFFGRTAEIANQYLRKGS